MVLDGLFEFRVGDPLGNIPNLNGSVTTGGGKLFLVHRDGNGFQFVIGNGQLANQGLTRHGSIKDLNAIFGLLRSKSQVVHRKSPLFSGTAAGHNKLVGIQKGHRHDPAGANGNPLLKLARFDIPNHQFMMPRGYEVFSIKTIKDGRYGKRKRIARGKGGGDPALAQFANEVRLGIDLLVEFGPLANPFFDHRDLGGGHAVPIFLGGHLGFVESFHHIDDVAVIGFTRNNWVVFGSAFAHGFIFGEVELPLRVFGTMATEAIFSEDRSHIFNKRRVGGGLPPSRLGKEDGCGNKKGGKAR